MKLFASKVASIELVSSKTGATFSELEMFDVIISALKEMKCGQIKRIDNNSLQAHTKISCYSWSEKISIKLLAQNKLEIISESYQLIDWASINRSNIEEFSFQLNNHFVHTCFFRRIH